MLRVRRNVYLDNNATTRPSPSVEKRMREILKNTYGNPSSLHSAGRQAAVTLEDARLKVATAIGCAPSEICFTGSASEANNAVIKGLAELRGKGKNKILSTPIEHPSIIATLEYLRGQGLVIEYIPVEPSGRISMERLEAMVDDGTLLVCCMRANNEIGTIQDVSAVSAIAHHHGAMVLSDCVQALGKIPVDVKELRVDYATFSAHKIHGPKGIGALYIKDGSPVAPLIHGGLQEAGLRAGTESLHNIAGFAEACGNIAEMLSKAEAVRALRDQLVAGLLEIKPDLRINTPKENALGNTANVTFPGTDNAVLMAALDYHGIAVSAGSACHTQANEPSHVLAAIGLSAASARQTLRLSVGYETTPGDIHYAIGVFRDFLTDKLPTVGAIQPSQLNEDLLLRPETYILDVRFPYDRKLLKSLPNSHELSFLAFRKQALLVPRDADIIVVCQGGVSAPMVAYFLRAKGYRKVNFLMTGMAGWRLIQPGLYEKYAGKNIVKLGAAGDAVRSA